jgi:hypothetical protein
VLPTYPTLLAAVEMDDTGSTRIGKYVFNHAFLIPGDCHHPVRHPGLYYRRHHAVNLLKFGPVSGPLHYSLIVRAIVPLFADTRFTMTTPDAVVVLCTAPDEATAQDLAAKVLAEKLAACATLLPGATSLLLGRQAGAGV